MNAKPGHRNVVLLIIGCMPMIAVAADAASSPEEARRAMTSAVTFFREHVATHGGYLWWYSEDLRERWGEGKATATQIWVQPPGTPSVGLAMLRAWQRTGEQACLEGARDAAYALVAGQLNSGGWAYSIEFDPDKRKGRCYRVDGHGRDDESCQERHHLTTYDDDTTQAAIRFLARYDRATNFKDERVHDCVLFALETVLRTQYPNGGWPQRTWGRPDPNLYPPRPAQYAATWSRQWPQADYINFCTINDGVIPDLIETLLVAHDIYRDEKYLKAAVRGGEFLLRAQMPDPQPAWAQQYDLDMYPAWARKFEPPSIVTRESYDVLLSLMQLYIVTGDDRFREPVPRAVAWMKRVRLPDGRLPRFLELRTDRPLYFTRDYELVYKSDDVPTHYAFITRVPLECLDTFYSRLDEFRAEYLGLLARRPAPTVPHDVVERLLEMNHEPAGTPQAVRKVVDALDAQGRWVEDGRIECGTFCTNLEILSTFVLQKKHSDG